MQPCESHGSNFLGLLNLITPKIEHLVFAIVDSESKVEHLFSVSVVS